jgi:hypothetical protein
VAAPLGWSRDGGFLVIVGRTGGVLAFHEELDLWLNPAPLTVAASDAPRVDPIALHDRVALYPNERIDSLIIAAALCVKPRGLRTSNQMVKVDAL